MGIITKAEMQKKNPDRMNLYIDGAFFCSLSATTFAASGYKSGSSVDERTLEKMVFESDKVKAFDYALTYISRYNPTIDGMRRKLFDKGYGTAAVSDVIRKVCDYGYLDDAEYCRAYIQSKSAALGRRRIIGELKRKGVDEAIIEGAMADYKESGTAYTLALRRSASLDLDNSKDVARLARFLQYRGFDWADVSSCIERLKSERTSAIDE